MKKLLRWSHDHPWVWTAFGLGVLVGLLLSFPLLPYTLPDAAASLLGSVIGAGIAVAGAVWVAQLPEQKKRTIWTHELRSAVLGMQFSVVELVRSLRRSAEPNLVTFQMQVQRLLWECNTLRNALTALRGKASDVGVEELRLVAQLQNAAIELGDSVESTLKAALRQDILVVTSIAAISAEVETFFNRLKAHGFNAFR